MTFVSHIYIVKENGFITNTKFRGELNLSTVKQGENITSCYNETYPLYNLYHKNADNNCAFFQDGQLTFLTQEDMVEKVKNLFPLLINQIASSNVGDLLNSYKKPDGTVYRESVFNEYLQHLTWTTQHEITPTVEEFSLDKYRSIANELHFLSENLHSQNQILGHFVKASIKGFNTFLAYEGIITDFSSGLFSTYRNEETNQEEVSYNEAIGALNYAERICNNTVQLGNKEQKKLKIK